MSQFIACGILAAAFGIVAWQWWRECDQAARQQAALTQALTAHAEDMTALIAILPPDEIPAALIEWQERQARQ